MSIQTRIDSKRGCGWRKPGGLYMISGGVASACGKMPIPLEVCPTCHAGVHPARGWTWVDSDALLKDRPCVFNTASCQSCTFSQPIGRVGLLWIGEKFYPTAVEWLNEATVQGVSRRIVAVPKDFKVGETWVLMAHRKAIPQPDGKWTPGICFAFRPTAVEYVVKGTETPEEIAALEKRGITPVEVQRDIDVLASDLLHDAAETVQ